MTLITAAFSCILATCNVLLQHYGCCQANDSLMLRVAQWHSRL
jgi:hypothetical protein